MTKELRQFICRWFIMDNRFYCNLKVWFDTLQVNFAFKASPHVAQIHRSYLLQPSAGPKSRTALGDTHLNLWREYYKIIWEFPKIIRINSNDSLICIRIASGFSYILHFTGFGPLFIPTLPEKMPKDYTFSSNHLPGGALWEATPSNL